MTRSVTSARVSVTTARNASVRRHWKERGRSRRRRSAIPCGGSGVRSALGEGVTDTSHRQHEHRRGRVVLDLVAQMAHVDVDGLLVLVEGLVVAQELEQLAARVHPTGTRRQVAQDLELGWSEADPPVATLDATPLEVDEEVAMPDDPAAHRVGQVAVRP